MLLQAERRRVCARCAKIKQSCDGADPCSRCIRTSHLSIRASLSSRINFDAGLRVDCVPKGSADVEQVGVTPQISKATIKRDKSGCLTCKQRRKKCDEVKPKCADCRRLNLTCSWPSPARAKPRNKRQVAPHEEETAPLPDPLDDDPVASHLPVEVQVDVEEEAGHWMPEAAPDLDLNDLIGAFDLPLVTLPAGTDASEISLSAAFDLPPITLQPSSESAPSPASSLTQIIPSTVPELTIDEDRALLNHFIKIVAPNLSRTKDTEGPNPYLSTLMPLTLENKIVLDSVLALSANHWRRTQPRFATRGQFHQSNATQALVELLPQVDDRNSADVALVSSLILCMSELFDGKSSSWRFHLKGAKRLLIALRDQEKRRGPSSHHRFLIRLYQYLDSAATTSTCRPPVIQEITQTPSDPGMGTPPGLIESDLNLAEESEDDAAVYGIPKALFHLVDRVNTLAFKRKFRVDKESEEQFQAEASKVAYLIDSWAFSYGGAARAVSKLCGSQDAQYAATAFEWALRIRLHQIVEGYSLDDSIIPTAVDGILDAIQKIRYGSPVESCLIYPLVMAGGICEALEQQLIIQDRLMVMERTCGFGYVHGARELVEKVWKRREQCPPRTIVNWARIRFEEMDGLVVF